MHPLPYKVKGPGHGEQHSAEWWPRDRTCVLDPNPALPLMWWWANRDSPLGLRWLICKMKALDQTFSQILYGLTSPCLETNIRLYKYPLSAHHVPCTIVGTKGQSLQLTQEALPRGFKHEMTRTWKCSKVTETSNVCKIQHVNHSLL